ncbi:MATE family efflux transporter [Sphingobium sp. SCG-1]|uniref:MATE family efflux transporter n=1 Tax=Sphingobium sp. SCG-1 TaxID=2072936 RepID=UPI000CD6A824|nr:MATE family efflux transporter [Sphingobium sp. SCG-1]AUW59069.1 MATE family efflux transporter [Sphingobium sp. SCG-1]
MASQAGSRRVDLTTGPVSRTLLVFALPTLASNVLQSLNGSINSVWVGRFLGEGALAATANANIIMFLLFSAVFGFGMAATVMVGQAMGRRDLDAARAAFGSALGFCFGLSIVVAISGWIAAPMILHALATPGPAFDFALTYLRVIFTAMPASLLSVMIMMGLRGAGDSITPLWFMILSVVLDSGLNPLFIRGLGPVPAMGIAGSAAATAVAGYISLCAMLFYIYRKDLPLRLRGAEFAYLIPSRAQLSTIVVKGFPMGLQMIVISTAGLIMIGLVNREGLMTSAAYGAAQQLWTYLQMPAMAIGAAVSAMAAQNIGAGRWDRVNGITWRGMLFNVVMTGSLIGLMLAFDRPVLALFLGSNSAAIDVARHMQFLASWSFMLFGLTMVLFGTMRSNGVVFAPLLILILALYPMRLGFYHLAYPALGADAIWLSFPVGSLTSLALAGAFYLHGGWRNTKLMVPPDEEECREQTNAATEPTGRMAPTG